MFGWSVDDSVLPEWPPSAHAHPKAIERRGGGPPPRRYLGSRTSDLATEMAAGRGASGAGVSPEELALLSLQIAEAFALARPDERVTFYLSQPQTSVKRVITSGGIYLRGTELHFILGNWQTLYGIPTYGLIYDRRYPMRPTAAKGFDLFFDPGQAIITQRSSLWDTLLANTNDELVIDLTKVDSGPIASLAIP